MLLFLPQLGELSTAVVRTSEIVGVAAHDRLMSAIRGPRLSRYWTIPIVFSIGMYLALVVASIWAPQGRAGHDIRLGQWVAAGIALAGLVAMIGGLLTLLVRVSVALRNRIPRRGDHELALYWNAAASSAQHGVTHLVYVSPVRRHPRGNSAWCRPYGPSPASHSSWFEGYGARSGRWMHLTGGIGPGRRGDDRVYVDRILTVFSKRARLWHDECTKPRRRQQSDILT